MTSHPTATGEDTTVSQLLARWEDGERGAAEELMPRVYDELRRMAHQLFQSERSDHTLQPTELVHEVYLKLQDNSHLQLVDRQHFLGLAACMMRRVLVDYARRRAFQKRGGGAGKVPMEEVGERLQISQQQISQQPMVALDDALTDLARMDHLKALIVELRYFGGLTVDEVAQCLDLSPRSVARHWQRARMVLYSQLDTNSRDAL